MSTYTKPPSSLTLRQLEGLMVKSQRVGRGLTQQELAEAVGLTNKQTIASIECGARNIPVERVAAFADVFRIPRQEFARKVLSYQNPHMYVVLHPDHITPEVKAFVDAPLPPTPPSRPATRRRRGPNPVKG